MDPQQFTELFGGSHQGATLVQSAGKQNHRPGWDLTFSAPKSVSTAWSQADRETQLEFQAAQLSAVDKAIDYLEEHALWTRRGKAGHEFERCKLIVATFEHGTSRAQDPQLHTHAVLLNIALREDGTTGTLETKSLYQHKMAAGALYRAELAHQLGCRLGLSTCRERSWFELKDVPEPLIEEFSTRRQQIEASLAERGLSGAKAAEIAAFDTREKKAHIARATLFEQWRGIGAEHGWSTSEFSTLVKGRHPQNDLLYGELRAASQSAVSSITEKRAFFTEKDLVRAVAEHAQGVGGGAEAVLAATQAELGSSKEVVRLGTRLRENLFTTPEMLRLEQELLGKVKESSQNPSAHASEGTLSKVFGQRPTITAEQKDAVRHITQGQGTVCAVTGMAGTGKTYMLDAAREALEAEGYHVLGAALAGKAAEGLDQGAHIPSSTVASLLKRMEGGHFSFDSKTVLVVDEAGMIGTRHMHALVDATQSAGAKLVLVGDERQLQPIDAGAPFAAISRELGTVTLSNIVRQREDWQRDAVKDLAFGNTNHALQEYAERGLVSVADNHHQAAENLLEAWKQQGLQKPEENIIIAGTNGDSAQLNRRAQELRSSEGFLREEFLKVGGEQFHPGDRILFTRNSAAVGVKNGTLGTVLSVHGFLERFAVRLDSGEERTFSAQNYSHVKLGYALTTHKAQGLTTENAFILTSETMQDRELSYVQASRARGETRFFTTQAEAGEGLATLAQTMHCSRQKEMATSAAQEAQSSHESSHDHSI